MKSLAPLQERALEFISQNVSASRKLPERVFSPKFTQTFVFDFEWLLRKNTPDLFRLLTRFEGSSVVAMVNLETTGERSTPDGSSDLVFISEEMSNEFYWNFIRRNVYEFANNRATPEMEQPWIVFCERLAACSDMGDWCIVGEKFAEIAVLGFKNSPSPLLQKKLLSEFGVERLVDALKRDNFFGEPGNVYSKEQREILRAAYLQ